MKQKKKTNSCQEIHKISISEKNFLDNFHLENGMKKIYFVFKSLKLKIYLIIPIAGHEEQFQPTVAHNGTFTEF